MVKVDSGGTWSRIIHKRNTEDDKDTIEKGWNTETDKGIIM